MLMASWNVNGIRAIARNGFVDWLEDCDFDLVFLQETKASPNQLPKELRDLSWDCALHSSTVKKGYSGVGVFWRDEAPDEVFEGLGIERFDQEGRAIGVRYGDLVVYGCYFPNGGRGPERVAYKLDFYAAMLDTMKAHREAGREVVVCGDFNIAHHPIDLSRPRESRKTSGFLEEERAWLDRFEREGWFDTFRRLHPDEAERYSWWDYRTRGRERNVGWRIDYFWADQALADRIIDADILHDEYGSDHCPVTLELSD